MRVTYFYDMPAPVAVEITPPDGLDEDELQDWLEAQAPPASASVGFIEYEPED